MEPLPTANTEITQFFRQWLAAQGGRRRWAAEWIKSSAEGFLRMMPVQPRYRPTVDQLAKAHTFRFLTTIATWALIFAAFIYHPEWIRESLRFITHSIETIADQVPEPWGARLEIMLRELGGIYLASNRYRDRFAPVDHLGAIPSLATGQRSQAFLTG